MHFREEDGFKKQRKKKCVCVCGCVYERERERKGGRRKIKNGDTNRKTDKSWFFALKSILNDGTYFVNLIECIWTRFLSWFSLQQGFFSFLGFVNCWPVIWFMSNQGQHVKKMNLLVISEWCRESPGCTLQQLQPLHTGFR